MEIGAWGMFNIDFWKANSRISLKFVQQVNDMLKLYYIKLWKSHEEFL